MSSKQLKKRIWQQSLLKSSKKVALFVIIVDHILLLHRSGLHCALHTVTTEGVQALYKGFIPSFARMGPWNVIFFIVYEKLKSFKI